MKGLKYEVLFVALRYYPSTRATAQHLTDLAEGLARRGYQIGVVCGSEDDVSAGGELPRSEIINKVHVYRVRTTTFGRTSTIGRSINTLVFYGKVLFLLWTKLKCGLLITLTAPPMISLVGALSKKGWGQDYAIWSLDLHPDAEFATGMLNPAHRLSRWFSRIDQFILRNAFFVVDLGRCMRSRLLEKGVAGELLYTIPIWNKASDIFPIGRDENVLVEGLNLRDRIVVMYSGNAGLLHRFGEVMDVVERMQPRREIIFLFVGGGLRKQEIEAFAHKHQLPNFRYLDYFPRDQIRYSLSLADIHLITLGSGMAGIAIPSKLYGAMAAARPLIMVGPESSEISLTIREVGCGFVIDPDKEDDAAEALEAAIDTLVNDVDLRETMGRRGRDAFLKYYECEIAVDQWKVLLDDKLNRAELLAAETSNI